MGMFQDWISEVNRLSPEEEAELGSDVRVRSARSLGMGKSEPPPKWTPPNTMPLQKLLGEKPKWTPPNTMPLQKMLGKKPRLSKPLSGKEALSAMFEALAERD